jgi:hypothetical protein
MTPTTTQPPKKKTCVICKQEKILSEFYRQHEAKDGRRNACKPCDKQQVLQEKAKQVEYGKKFFTF